MRNKFRWNVDKVNEIMEKRGMKQKDVAAKLNGSPQLISYYLRSTPTVKKLVAIASALSVKSDPVDWRDLIA